MLPSQFRRVLGRAMHVLGSPRDGAQRNFECCVCVVFLWCRGPAEAENTKTQFGEVFVTLQGLSAGILRLTPWHFKPVCPGGCLSIQEILQSRTGATGRALWCKTDKLDCILFQDTELWVIITVVKANTTKFHRRHSTHTAFYKL